MTTDGLRASNVSVHFGGVVAVSNVTLDAPLGRLVGLIGPNGAGKTTTFNVCSGLQRAGKGTVHLFGRDVTGLGPAARAQRGLGRTFQRMELYDSLTVETNVALGMEAAITGNRLLGQLYTTRAERAAVVEATEEAIERCALQPLRHRVVGSLSTGQRRLVELARVLAGPFRLLLLDEPSSGLDNTETAQFADILLRVVRERGVGILLVEHDMGLVSTVCDYVYVLDFGQLIFEGTMAEAVTSEKVRAAYLGSEEIVSLTPLGSD